MKDNAEMTPKGYGSGTKPPAGASASDSSGERHGRIVNGVGMGKADGTGKNSTFDGGRSKGMCYTHDRSSYQK
jgi:hypothetical protein